MIGVQIAAGGELIKNVVHLGDCITIMRCLPDQSIDAIIGDPPYGTTELAWDQPIHWPLFWREAERILRSPASPTILFSQQPFTTDLININRTWFRYEIIWEKTASTGFLDANRRPLRNHENMLVFGAALPAYDPQFETSNILRHKAVKSAAASHYGKHQERATYVDDGTRYPCSVWKFSGRHSAFKKTKSLHPTQKPTALMDRLILSYTKAGDLILDPFAGSGSTLVSARQLGRNYIGCDTDQGYVKTARERLEQPYSISMFG